MITFCPYLQLSIWASILYWAAQIVSKLVFEVLVFKTGIWKLLRGASLRSYPTIPILFLKLYTLKVGINLLNEISKANDSRSVCYLKAVKLIREYLKNIFLNLYFTLSILDFEIRYFRSPSHLYIIILLFALLFLSEKLHFQFYNKNTAV